MDRRQIVVETGLSDEVDYRGVSFVRHARTRFVEGSKKPETPKFPELGDPWCALTVRARLERMGETYRRLPHSPDTRPQQHKSCMPTPLLELFKDMPPGPLRPGVTDAALAAANQAIDGLNNRNRRIAWAVANKINDNKLGKWLGHDRNYASRAKQMVLKILALRWNHLGWRPDHEDVAHACAFLHRNFD